jgi:signal transduction histidine kinase
MKLLAEDGGIKLACEATPHVVIEGDRARLKQVLVNLLDNAIKYSSRGGQVTVRVGQADGHAVLDVCDRGIGIPSEAQKHLFERFYRVDKARSRELGGAGLGLSIVKSICSAHGGTVRVRSKEGEGTQFTVELPTAARKA